jgi:hypothetical protein
MLLYCAAADSKKPSDLVIAPSSRENPEHFLFTRAELRGKLIVGGERLRPVLKE